MALLEENSTPQGKPTQNIQSQKTDKREKPLTKVVIRRLPPTIGKETFLDQISPVPSYDYFYLVNGEASFGENSFSRAYINFINPNDVFDFKEKFDNYVFLDNKGNEYTAVVEFAAFQKIPKKRNRNRADPKCGTIESDPYYLEFIELLNKPVKQEENPEYSYQFSSESKENKDSTTTPLLDFVKNRRAERMRIREERDKERKRKELERKRLKEEERRKRFEKSPSKVLSKPKIGEELSDSENKEEKSPQKEVKSEKPTEKSNEKSSFKNRDKKFEDKKKDPKIKPSPRKDFSEKREFKNRRENYKGDSKYEPHKKEEKQFPKRMKKYSEKREERRMEAQKASEMKKGDDQDDKTPTKLSENPKQEKTIEKVEKTVDKVKYDEKHESKRNEEASQEHFDNDYKSEESGSKENRRERIRNKDRPTIAIYRPGMLSKRKVTDGEVEKESK